ncbi:hypothetical protein [Bacteroides sp.]|uniref:hypothetical protein n=1 Tax=Bacteroides sp. TaxID=29523 RepID=UPI002617DAD4|nr:hypothetical protein [Bacteroides sp.]MDD3040474.1 hypothetical protein [Bacteroides sp.]
MTCILVMTVFAILKSAFTTGPVYVGNKWLTLFGNEHCMYLMLAPLFFYLGTSLCNIKVIEKAIGCYMLLSAWSLFVDGLALLPIMWVAGVLFPYVDKKYRFLLLLALIESIYAGFFRAGTVRTQIIVIVVSFMSYYLPRYASPKLLRSICYSMVIIPLVYSAIMLVDPQFSVFDVILSYLDGQTGNQELITDSRSFLFYEMSEDLTRNHAWILGKGASSTYESSYFLSTNGEGDFHLRIVSEVTFLHLLMRGGIVYVALYFGAILYAIKKALTNPKNKFVQSIAIMASGWLLVASFSSEMGTTLIHVAVYALIGCCFSNNIVRMSDNNIKEVLKLRR